MHLNGFRACHVFLRFTAHIDNVGVVCDIFSTVLDAVILFVIHDVEPI